MTISLFGTSSNPTDGPSAFFDEANKPCVLTPPASMVAGDLVFVLCSHNSGSTTRDFSVSATGGQTWTAGTSWEGSAPGTNSFYCTFNGTWGANPSFTTLGSDTFVDMIAAMVVFRPTSGSATWSVDVAEQAATFAAPGSPFDVTRAGQTSIAASTVTVAWFSAQDDNTWTLQTGGWSTAFAQVRSTINGLSVSIVYLIQSSPAATGSVVNRQATLGGDAGWAGVMTFAETLASKAPPPRIAFPQVLLQM